MSITMCASCSSRQHYWRPVAARSLRAYGVKLRAACRAGYTTMFMYLRCPSPKKPLTEIDPAPFFSTSTVGSSTQSVRAACDGLPLPMQVDIRTMVSTLSVHVHMCSMVSRKSRPALRPPQLIGPRNQRAQLFTP